MEHYGRLNTKCYRALARFGGKHYINVGTLRCCCNGRACKTWKDAGKVFGIGKLASMGA